MYTFKEDPRGCCAEVFYNSVFVGEITPTVNMGLLFGKKHLGFHAGRGVEHCVSVEMSDAFLEWWEK